MVLWLKALHIVAVIAWMAGLLYLPRLFVYHAEKKAGTPESETFKLMERRLLRYIMTPAGVAVWVTGPLLAWQLGVHRDGWFLAKMLCVVLLTIVHQRMAVWCGEFTADRNIRPPRFFRIANEVPTVLLLAIVVLVVVKPF